MTGERVSSRTPHDEAPLASSRRRRLWAGVAIAVAAAVAAKVVRLSIPEPAVLMGMLPNIAFGGRTFDPWDIVASGLGALIGYLLVRRMVSEAFPPA